MEKWDRELVLSTEGGFMLLKMENDQQKFLEYSFSIFHSHNLNYFFIDKESAVCIPGCS